MELISVELEKNPVAISDYKSYDVYELPKAFLGVRIKNEFDEKRFTFKPEYNAIRISHFCGAGVEPVFFYGVEIDLQDRYSPLLKSLNKFASTCRCTTIPEMIGLYKAILVKHGLSCDDCYGYLYDGLYPVDVALLSELVKSDTTLPVHNLPSMLEISKEQWYLNLGAFGIYILGSCGSYG